MSDSTLHNANQQRFEQLLPFYVTNKLSDNDLIFVQTYIAQNDDAKKAVHFTQALSQIVRDTGTRRNPDAALNRLLADFKPRQRMSLLKRLLAKLRSLGISPPLALALLVIVGQGVGYAAHKMNWFGSPKASAVSPVDADFSMTLKRGADMGAIATILDKFGGHIVHSTAGSQLEKVFISVVDKTRIQQLIDALMELGIVDSIAVLL